MVNIDIILTVDYEIHGNGRGSFEDFCYRPVEMMLTIANQFNAKITLMVEMEHYFAMMKHPDIFENELFLFEKQLNRAIAEGHDVQLHLHPQWLNAKYEDGIWKFPYSAKEIALLCNDYELAKSRIKLAKNWLEANLKLVDDSYECIGFRAGYFQMQPSFNISRALIDNGIICDTSVAKGMFRDNDSVGKIDYRSAISTYYPFRASLNEISVMDKSSALMEMPIFTLKYNRIIRKLKKAFSITDKKVIIAETISKIQRSKVPLPITVEPKRLSNLGKVPRQFSIFGHYYVDFCTGDPQEMAKEAKRVAKNVSKDTPLVFMGHSKDFVYPNHFKYFLNEISKSHEIKFATLRSAINKYYTATICKNECI